MATIDHLLEVSDSRPSTEFEDTMFEAVVRGRVDATRIGVIGHSFGGATATAVTSCDPRIVACIGYVG